MLDSGTAPPFDEVRLLVCITCRKAGEPDDAVRPGARLHTALTEALKEAGPDFPKVSIEPVECLSVCKRPCTMALSAPGRWTYIYGDLDPQISIDAILDGLRRYHATDNGIVPWRERPEAFRKGVVARIPPLSRSPEKTS
ncbi:DUF1636 family protein [Microvirga sp. 2MCAF38]|uniref:DUF1636 family protein n=1 Tax=Microvirga sp. 2MCAF38 TaxID=3232989 RepID=UPI003F9CB11F